ncbi:hypothetical protein V6N13_055582 [Hibiscus sabdariffa]
MTQLSYPSSRSLLVHEITSMSLYGYTFAHQNVSQYRRVCFRIKEESYRVCVHVCRVVSGHSRVSDIRRWQSGQAISEHDVQTNGDENQRKASICRVDFPHSFAVVEELGAACLYFCWWGVGFFLLLLFASFGLEH